MKRVANALTWSFPADGRSNGSTIRTRLNLVNAGALSHLRSGGRHLRGSRVLDLVLGKP